jgi:hypothetical protein
MANRLSGDGAVAIVGFWTVVFVFSVIIEVYQFLPPYRTYLDNYLGVEQYFFCRIPVDH